jgi:hypothetical protein
MDYKKTETPGLIKQISNTGVVLFYLFQVSWYLLFNTSSELNWNPRRLPVITREC